MTTIDLDAARAAREKQRKEPPPPVTFGGVTFVMPSEPPLALMDAARVVLENAADGSAVLSAVSKMGRALFGDRYDEFIELGASAEDLRTLIEELMSAYGMTLGESQASGS